MGVVVLRYSGVLESCCPRVLAPHARFLYEDSWRVFLGGGGLICSRLPSRTGAKLASEVMNKEIPFL